MKNIKKAIVGLSLGLSMLLVGCGDSVYTKDQLKLDSNKKIVYEKDGKTFANGSFSYKTALEDGKIILNDGLIESVVINKGTEKMEAKYKDRKLLSLDFGENSKIEYFDDGKLKYLIFNDKQVKGEIKFNKGEEFPYYFLNEAKPSNSRGIFENDILTLSQLDNQQIFETHKKDSKRTQMILSQVTDAMKTLANTLSENVYNQALKEIN
ncbi:hypothetical protein [Arcobacter sp. s6]|uniref:hypothetical protein n=1 Tax=Arcobacter sp. s6 TaxID=3230363 RepID=UPI0034A0615A